MCRLFAVALVLVTSAACLLAQPATAPLGADGILAAIDSLPYPDFDRARGDDQAYRDQFLAEQRATSDRQDQLERELCERFPDHPQAQYVQARRWSNWLVTHSGEDTEPIRKEVAAFLAANPGGCTDPIAQSMLLSVRGQLAAGTPDDIMAIAQDLIQADPRDEKAARYMFYAASETTDPQAREKLLQRIIVEYPGCPEAVTAGGMLRQPRQVGRPFSLSFSEATTDKFVSLAQMRGKVVLVDFWATWCGPCVGQIPHLQELYARHKDRGFEIVGVSLDGPESQTNQQTLKDFVVKNKVTWPQYYTGDGGFDARFPASWGVRAIPTVFLIDRSGRLRYIDADRDKLEELITGLLDEKPPVVSKGNPFGY